MSFWETVGATAIAFIAVSFIMPLMLSAVILFAAKVLPVKWLEWLMKL